MKRLLVAGLVGVLTVFPVLAQKKDLPLVAVTQIIEHPALGEVYRGLIDGLKEKGYEDGKTIRLDYQIAQGDMALNMQIAKQFAGENPAVIVASTTPSAQAAIAAVHGKIPVIFTAISDPVGAQLVTNMEKPGKNVTGVKEALAYDANVETIAELLPELKALGTVSNPGEDNSVTTNRVIEEMAKARGWTFINAPAKNTGDVLDAARSLVGKVDAILITMDNTAVSAFPSIAQVADQNKIPLFVFDTFSVPNGAAVGIGYEEYDVGKLTADQVAAVLEGKNPGDIPVAEVETTRIVLNEKAAKKQGLTLPQSLKDKAAEVIQ